MGERAHGVRGMTALPRTGAIKRGSIHTTPYSDGSQRAIFRLRKRIFKRAYRVFGLTIPQRFALPVDDCRQSELLELDHYILDYMSRGEGMVRFDKMAMRRARTLKNRQTVQSVGDS